MSFDQDKVKEIIAEAAAEFATAYPNGYVKAVVKKIEAEIEGVPRPPLALLEKRPLPEYYKQGWVTKKGAIVKNWKKRWFTVDREYRIAYWMGEKDPHDRDPKTGKLKKKPKGTFTCYGYKCKKDEDKESKEHQMKLTPYWDDEYTKRTWHFQFSTKEDYDAWKKMFQECIYNSPNPMHKDPVRRKAFEYAYKAMERSWYFYPTGTEEEMLAYVVMRRCERLVLSEAYQALPSGAMRWKAIDKMRSTVASMIAPSAAGAWKSAQATVDRIEQPTEDNIRKVVAPLFQAIKAVKERARVSFQARAVPMIALLMAPVSEKLIPKICLPLIRSQKELIEEFIKHASDESRGSWHLYWELRRRENEYDAAIDTARSLLDEWELRNLPTMIMDSCFELLEDARYNFSRLDDRKIELTCAKLLHDCLKEQHRILTWLVELLVLKPFNDKFGAMIDELCGPLEDLIPVPVKEFLSPFDVIKSMAEMAMQSAIQACITAGDQSSVPEKMASYFTENRVIVDTRKMAEMAQAKQARQDEECKTPGRSSTIESADRDSD